MVRNCITPCDKLSIRDKRTQWDIMNFDWLRRMGYSKRPRHARSMGWVDPISARLVKTCRGRFGSPYRRVRGRKILCSTTPPGGVGVTVGVTVGVAVGRGVGVDVLVGWGVGVGVDPGSGGS